MSDTDQTKPENGEEKELQQRREFLQGLGKWSGASIAAAVGGVWLLSNKEANAGGWLNRRGGYHGGGGGWINGHGGGHGGGGWLNRHGGGGGSWINRRH